jgi:GDP-4-dehydro-6-deoxy-D-mannose reductase
VITGGRGFVGGHLCAHLVAEGDEVVVLDRSDDFDVCDPDSTARTIADAHPEVVYHLAAFAHVGASWSSPATVFRVNVEGTYNVIEAARTCGARRVIIVGSAEEYGRAGSTGEPLPEHTPVAPLSPYGVSKATGGLLARQAFLAHGLATIHVRPFNHTGPGQAPTFLAPALARRIIDAEREGADHIAVGNLDPVRELLDVRDVVRAYRLLADHGEPGEIYNVARGHGYRVREIAETLLSFAGSPIRLEVDPALVRPVDVPALVGDSTKLGAATQWSPEYDLTATLRSVWDSALSG